MKAYIYLSTIIFSMAFMSCEDNGAINPETLQRSNTSKKVTPEKVNPLADKLTAAVPTGYNVSKNQSYGSVPTQVYDLYTPILSAADNGKKSVSLVMVHGGGWSLLDKSFLDDVVELFKKQNLNLTIFNINHRLPLSDNVNFPSIMEDFDLFFAHQQSLKTSLNLSDDVILWGYSSGGHLALTYSYKYPKPYIKAIAAVVAPTDLTKESIHKGIIFENDKNLTEILMGTTYQNNPKAYESASPIFQVSSQSANTVLFYGGKDNLVDDEEQGRRLYNKLIEYNVKANFHILPDATHEMKGQMGGIVNTTVAFVKQF